MNMPPNNCVIDTFNYPLGKDTDGKLCYIKDVQTIIMDIILEIDRVCRKNNIPYALAFGSALGLYNYQGFIPWDDDADIMVDYFDLPKIIAAFKKDLKEDYEFICYEVDERCNVLIPTMKVKKRVGYMQDKNWYVIPDRTKSYEGFFVDIVAFMGMKDAKTHKRLIAKSQFLLVPYFILDGILRIDPKHMKRSIKKKECKIATLYQDAPYVCQSPIIPFQTAKINLFPRDIIYPLKEYTFNGHRLFSFNNIETFCKIRYGSNCLKQLEDGVYVDKYPLKKRKSVHIRKFHF